MATMSDWAKDLDDMLADCLNGSEETDRPRRWRYSGFFDWFSDQKKPGFLPDFGIDGGSPLKIGSGHPLGLDTGSYNVNARSIFIGLNPTFPKKPSLKVNNGYFAGFNMDGATSGKSFGSGYSLDDFWKLCGLVIAGKDTSNLYNYYKASYMTDFAVLESAGEHNVAFESISNDAMHREIFLGDMRLFKQFVLQGSNGDKALDILALGEKAYQLLGAVKYELGELFPSGKVWQVRHYANGGAIHLMQNLLWIYNERNRGSAICLPVFPPIRPGKSMVLSS